MRVDAQLQDVPADIHGCIASTKIIQSPPVLKIMAAKIKTINLNPHIFIICICSHYKSLYFLLCEWKPSFIEEGGF